MSMSSRLAGSNPTDQAAASYNSYSKTSYGAQGGEDSGGFFAGGGSQQAGSQGGGGKVCDCIVPSSQ